MNKKYKELFKNTTLIAVGNFSSKILIFLLIPLYTRFLSTAEYGFYDLAYTTIQLLFPILTLGVTESIMYFSLKKKMPTAGIFSINLFFIFLASLVFDLLLLINHIFKIIPGADQHTILIAIFYTVFCLDQCLIQFAKGINKVKQMTIAGVIGSISMLSFNILLLVVFHTGLTGYFIANILGLFIPVTYLIMSLKCWQYLKFERDLDNYKKIILFSVPLIVNTLAWWVNNTADRYIITFFYGVEINGLISIAYKIPSALNAIGAIFIQAWQISAIKEHNSKAKEFYSRLFFVFNGFLIILSGFLIAFIKPIARVMFANNFFEAWSLVPFLLISSFINQSSGYIGAILTAAGKTPSLSRSAIVGVISNVVLNITLSVCFGPLGITVATMVSSLIIYLMRRHYAKGLISSDKYSTILLSWLLLLTMAIITIADKSYLIPIATYLILLIIYRNIFSYYFRFLKQHLSARYNLRKKHD